MKKSTTEKRKFYIGPPTMLKTIDMFGAPLPGFNLGGEDTIKTYCGGLLSSFIIMITLLFASLKLNHLLSRYNPQVNDYVEKSHFDHTDIYSPREHDFRMAVRIENYLTGEMKHDSNMVKWFAH